jgi:hypothetical protein
LSDHSFTCEDAETAQFSQLHTKKNKKMGKDKACLFMKQQVFKFHAKRKALKEKNST